MPQSDQETKQEATDRRRREATAKRVFVLGLDGATFDVLDPLMSEGRMPRLNEAVRSGASGVLHSTIPPITPAAWTTFLTGLKPDRHGIIDFERYDAGTNRLSFNSTRCLEHVRNLWQLAGDAGLRIGSINVPMTYPAPKVNGFLVSGFEAPGPDSDFVYPPQLKAEVLRRWPDPTLRSKWRRKIGGGISLFRENVGYMSRSFHQGAEMAATLADKHGWDVLMVVLKLVDNLQHKAWKYIDPRWSGRDPQRRDIVAQAFGELDVAIGRMLDYAARHDATTIIVSDHGHGSLEGKVQPNLLLRRWRYLVLKGGIARQASRALYYWDRQRGRTGRFARSGDVSRDLAVDFSRTRACVMHAGMAGFLYVNLKGRQPTGLVEPDEYEALREELIERFLGTDCRAIGPDATPLQLFREVHKPEELYGCSRDEQPWLPDLILIPHESLAVVRKIRGRRAVRWLSYRRLEGTHRPDGILIATGPGIASGVRVAADIIDCPPTILAMLGIPIPHDVEGRVINELFVTSPAIDRSAAPRGHGARAGSGENDVYSAEELAQVTERLMDLGYLE